jgi:hypothetical protein
MSRSLPRPAPCCGSSGCWPSILSGLSTRTRSSACTVIVRAPPRQVVVGRARVPLGHQRVAAALADGHRHHRVRVVHVAEQARAGRAGQHAGRLAFGFGQRGAGDAVHAQRALAHHLALFVELARAVGAGPAAVLAADALVVVDQHDAVLGALVAGAGGAHRHAGRVFAVQAALGEVHRLRVGELAHLEGLHAVEEGAAGVRRRAARPPAGRPHRRCSTACSSSRRRGSPRRR